MTSSSDGIRLSSLLPLGVGCASGIATVLIDDYIPTIWIGKYISCLGGTDGGSSGPLPMLIAAVGMCALGLVASYFCREEEDPRALSTGNIVCMAGAALMGAWIGSTVLDLVDGAARKVAASALVFDIFNGLDRLLIFLPGRGNMQFFDPPLMGTRVPS